MKKQKLLTAIEKLPMYVMDYKKKPVRVVEYEKVLRLIKLYK